MTTRMPPALGKPDVFPILYHLQKNRTTVVPKRPSRKPNRSLAFAHVFAFIVVFVSSQYNNRLPQ